MVTFKHSNIKVTVVVPVYNVEIYLRKCLDSLKNQTLKDIEFILIDDCSTDKSGIICDEYAKIDERFTVIHNKINLRQGLSRNIGIELAKGEYVGFIDADDYIDLNFYEKLYTSIKTNNTDIAKAESIEVLPDGEYIYHKELNTRIKKGIRNNPLFILFTYEHWTALYKKSILINHQIKYPDIRNGQDVVFLLRYTYFATSISLIQDVYYYYCKHERSTTSVKTASYFNSLLECFDLKIEFINTHKMFKKHYLEIYFQVLNDMKNEFRHFSNSSLIKYEYINKMVSTMIKYKYDKQDLLNNFYIGFIGKKKADNLVLGKITYKLFTIINYFRLLIIKN